MRNLKASPRIPFPQLPFSFGDKPVRQTTRRLRWGAGGGASRPRRVGLSVCGGARFTCPPPSGWRRGEAVSVEASGCEGSRRPSGAQAETFSAPHRPGPLLPSTTSEPTPTRKQPPGSERLTSVPRPRPQHKEPRKQLASWGPGRGPSQLQSHPERARRAPSTPHVGCFRRAPRSLGPDAPMGRGPTGARGGSRARPSAGFVPPARDGPPPLTGNMLGACPRGRDTLRRRASPAGRAGSPGESRLTPGAGRPVSALPGSPPSSATFAVQDATARGT